MRLILIFCGIYCCLEAGINFLDLLSFYENPDDFIKIYGIGSHNDHLQFKSVSFYKIWRIVLTILFLGSGIIAFSLLKKSNRQKSLLAWVVFVVTSLGILWELWAYYVWYQSGYDHYPGYDPFLF